MSWKYCTVTGMRYAVFMTPQGTLTEYGPFICFLSRVNFQLQYGHSTSSLLSSSVTTSRRCLLRVEILIESSLAPVTCSRRFDFISHACLVLLNVVFSKLHGGRWILLANLQPISFFFDTLTALIAVSLPQDFLRGFYIKMSKQEPVIYYRGRYLEQSEVSK
jgi:hypothetical protein